MLGPQASSAIPELLRMATDSKSRYVAWQATEALGSVGSEALPALVMVVTNKQALCPGRALISIGAMSNLGSNAVLVVPAILSCLNDKDADVVASAVTPLGRIPVEPATAVPAVAGCVHHRETYVRRMAADTLGRFSQAARPAVPELVRLLNDSDWSVRNMTTNALMRLRRRC